VSEIGTFLSLSRTLFCRIFISVSSFSLRLLILTYRADINAAAPAVDYILVLEIALLFIHNRGHVQKNLALVYPGGGHFNAENIIKIIVDY